MYKELDKLEQIRLAVDFILKGASIPTQLKELLGVDIIKAIENPN